MNKPIKNRGIFKIFVLLSVFVCLFVSAFVLVGCKGDDYNGSNYLVEFNKKQAVFTIAGDATISVRKQTSYFVQDEVQPIKVKEYKDYTKYYYKNGKDSSGQVFRIEKQGYVTKAGYFQTEGKINLPVCDSEDSLNNNFADIENSILTNVGDKNFKVLDMGEVFNLTAYRNNAIVNNYSSNVQIEPNFEYQVLKGDSVSVNQTKENVFSIKAVARGVTHVLLSYNQIDILNNSELKSYSSCDDNMRAVVTFAVGEEYTTNINITAQGSPIDSEFDIVYFEGEGGNLVITAPSADKVEGNILDKKVVYSKTVDGEFNLPIKEGYNIFEIFAGGKSSFLVLYGATINVHISGDLKVGSQISISVSGLRNVLPKFSGVYNPTQNYPNGEPATIGSNLCVKINDTDEVVAENVSQYDFRKNNIITFILDEKHFVDGKLELNFCFKAEWWGMELGAHRQIDSSGLLGNINADKHCRSIGFFNLLVINCD